MRINKQYQNFDKTLYYVDTSKYFDFASTTPVFANVIEDINEILKMNYGNPSSLTGLGIEAKNIIKEATASIIKDLGASQFNLYFTSGATESNNWVAQILQKGDTVFTTKFEHPSVINAFKSRKANIVYIDCLDNFDREDFINKLESLKPRLVSIMGVNNETGIIPNVSEIADICQGKTLVHCDITQLISHCIFNCDNFGFDFCSFSGHKFGAPKGIGGLLVKKSALKHLPNYVYGGHQQDNRRAGTENTAYIKGMATALHIATENKSEYYFRSMSLQEYFIYKLNKSLKNTATDCIIIGADNKNLLAIPSIVNVCFKGINGYTLMKMLDLSGLSVSTGSSCSADSEYTSPILELLKVPEDYIHGSIRVSFGYNTTYADIDYLIEKMIEAIAYLEKFKETNDE